MNIQKFVNGKWKENSYLISNQNECLLIDPGGSFLEISQYIIDNNLNLLAILNTHGHFDHIVVVEDLAQKFQCPFYLHSKDEKLLKSANFYLKLFEGDSKIKIPQIDYYLDSLNAIEIGEFSLEIIYTPGHTNGSVCFLIDRKLFSGDTLFKTDIGRLDLPGSDKLKMKQSLLLISKLSKNITVYPGHGGEFLLREAFEKNNKFLSYINE
jgi:hydroxyacylglutathione hydrolase